MNRIILALLATTSLALAHDGYTGWKVNGTDCCSNVHCFATSIEQHRDGTWWALDRNKVTWLPVDPKTIDWESKMSGTHACVTGTDGYDEDGDYSPRQVICAAIGGDV
jgi:hypothetical protein